MEISELWTCISCKHPECRREDFYYHLCVSSLGHKMNEFRCYVTLCDFLDKGKLHYRGYRWEFIDNEGNNVVAHQIIRWADE